MRDNRGPPPPRAPLCQSHRTIGCFKELTHTVKQSIQLLNQKIEALEMKTKGSGPGPQPCRSLAPHTSANCVHQYDDGSFLHTLQLKHEPAVPPILVQALDFPYDFLAFLHVWTPCPPLCDRVSFNRQSLPASSSDTQQDLRPNKSYQAHSSALVDALKTRPGSFTMVHGSRKEALYGPYSVQTSKLSPMYQDGAKLPSNFKASSEPFLACALSWQVPTCRQIYRCWNHVMWWSGVCRAPEEREQM